jgi:hypothetical protein
VVFVEGDFAGDDFTELGEFLFEGLTDDGLGNSADENVVTGEAGDVGAEEFVGEGEGTAGLVVDHEVAEGLAHFLEFGVVVNLNDGRVEGLVEVPAHLGHALDFVAAGVFDDLSELD